MRSGQLILLSLHPLTAPGGMSVCPLFFMKVKCHSHKWHTSLNIWAFFEFHLGHPVKRLKLKDLFILSCSKLYFFYLLSQFFFGWTCRKINTRMFSVICITSPVMRQSKPNQCGGVCLPHSCIRVVCFRHFPNLKHSTNKPSQIKKMDNN